jgi:hypothetical protein
MGNYLISLDNNLYKFDYPQTFNGTWTNYISVYFYLNKEGDLFVVNKSKIDISDKNLTKIIAKSKEIRDKDLNLVPQN